MSTIILRIYASWLFCIAYLIQDMSRIRVLIENDLGGQSNQFAFLSFFRSNKMGGRNTPRQFIIAAILMNIRTTFYGNQFTSELGNRLRVSLKELLELAD